MSVATHQMKELNLTKEDVLKLIEQSWTREEDWTSDNDSYEQKERGECYAMLMSGCAFKTFDDNEGNVMVVFHYKGFNFFYGGLEIKSIAQYYIPMSTT